MSTFEFIGNMTTMRRNSRTFAR